MFESTKSETQMKINERFQCIEPYSELTAYS